MSLPKTNKEGFTLVELLVVVSILAILAVVGVVVFQGQQKNARDTRRKADIEAIAQAMEAAKVPGQINYVALAASMFSAGSVPSDPTNTSEIPDNSCPGVCKYCVRATAGNCSTTDTAVAPGSPGVVATWVVCANLESGGSFCRANSQ